MLHKELSHHSSQISMEEFYQQVINDFGNRLFNKYNQKEQGFDSELIDQIKNRVKSKMERPQQLFSKALEIKHRSAGYPSAELEKNKSIEVTEVKKEQIDVLDNQEEDVDFANVFNPVEPEVKKEEENGDGVIKHEPNQDLDDEKDEQDEKEKRQSIERLKSNLNVHIVGTYEPRNKKHVAKDESTRLELDNVFIKFKNKSEEIFVPKLICEFKKQ